MSRDSVNVKLDTRARVNSWPHYIQLVSTGRQQAVPFQRSNISID